MSDRQRSKDEHQGNQEDAQEEDVDFEDDEEFKQEALTQEWEIMVPNYVVKKVMISQAMDDPS